jgi:hypothetical protein
LNRGWSFLETFPEFFRKEVYFLKRVVALVVARFFKVLFVGIGNY